MYISQEDIEGRLKYLYSQRLKVKDKYKDIKSNYHEKVLTLTREIHALEDKLRELALSYPGKK